MSFPSLPANVSFHDVEFMTNLDGELTRQFVKGDQILFKNVSYSDFTLTLQEQFDKSSWLVGLIVAISKRGISFLESFEELPDGNERLVKVLGSDGEIHEIIITPPGTLFTCGLFLK